MAAIHIRDIPENVLEALKRRAARNHRSLQMELRMVLTELAQQDVETPEFHFRLSDAGQGSWRREEVYGDDGR